MIATTTHTRQPPQRRRARVAAAWLCAMLAGCGGGFYIGVDGAGDHDPSVALTAVSEADAGAIVRLAAAATDDSAIESVSFYRQEALAQPTLLGADVEAPYALDTTIPVSAPGTVWRYFARAVDDAGQETDSAVIEITVR